MLVHRRFQLLQKKRSNMVSQVHQTEATHTFSIRVPESLYRLLRARAEELKVPQARLVVEGLKTRLGDTDVAATDSDRKDQENRN